MATEKGKIVHDGMGGFLNPPTHPEHEWSVQTDLRRRPENRGGMSLSTAATCEYLDPATRGAARRMLTKWVAPPIDSPEVVAWVRMVLGYFVRCYRNPDAGADEWNAGKLVIDANRDPMDTPAEHAGVHLIRKYYPDYQPTREDFDHAKWGK